MRIACLSGKGGAGKTLLAVNLAWTAGNATYIDCDVEEPNGYLFLRPGTLQEETVCVPLPAFDADKCTGCRKCVTFCRYHALAFVQGRPRVFAEMCHGCGGCALVCPEGAVTEQSRPIGTLETGVCGGVRVVTGRLNPGEASGVPIIRAALRHGGGTTLIDCPPGSACTALESAAAADYCLLVAEPTAFGLHNLQMVHELATLLGKPCGVVINREAAPYGPLDDYCQERGLPVLARIPWDTRLAEMAARGQIVAAEDEALRAVFCGILEAIGGAG